MAPLLQERNVETNFCWGEPSLPSRRYISVRGTLLIPLVSPDVCPSLAAIEWCQCLSIPPGRMFYISPFQQVMTYYVVYIFDMAGLTGNIGLISSGIQYAIFIVGTAATFFFIDTTGRRPLLIYGAVGMGICMVSESQRCFP